MPRANVLLAGRSRPKDRAGLLVRDQPLRTAPRSFLHGVGRPHANDRIVEKHGLDDLIEERLVGCDLLRDFVGQADGTAIGPRQLLDDHVRHTPCGGPAGLPYGPADGDWRTYGAAGRPGTRLRPNGTPNLRNAACFLLSLGGNREGDGRWLATRMRALIRLPPWPHTRRRPRWGQCRFGERRRRAWQGMVRASPRRGRAPAAAEGREGGA